MDGILRIVHQSERDLLSILHPKVIKELPSLEEVSDLFSLFINRIESLSNLSVRLGYFFSSRRNMGDRVDFAERYTTEYSKSLYTRRTWAIVAYPLEGEARFIPNPSFAIRSLDSWEWSLIENKQVRDPLLFYRPAPQNHSSENAVFFFRQNPSNKEYIDDLKVKNRLLGFPMLGPSLYLVRE